MFKNLQDNFLLRRLHSLSGMLPIGGFMVFHIFANSTAMFNADNYNLIINFLRSLPFVEYIEWIAIFIPIIFNALYGVLIYTTAKQNHMQYSGLENFRYILQRITGMIALLYIYYHVVQFKTVHDLDYNYIAKSLSSTQAIDWAPQIPFINPFSIYWFYVIGLVSTIYHFSNGLWGFCITWGITIGKRAQDAMSITGLVLFLVLSYISISTLHHLAEVGKSL